MTFFLLLSIDISQDYYIRKKVSLFHVVTYSNILTVNERQKLFQKSFGWNSLFHYKSHTTLYTNKKVTTKLLEKEIGSKYKARYAITHLIKEGKIKRIKTIGPNKIEYFYDIVKST